MTDTKQLLNEIDKFVDGNFKEVVNWRRHMHQYPELSFRETKTAQFIKEKLLSFGLQVKTNIGGNGVIGILEGDQKSDRSHVVL